MNTATLKIDIQSYWHPGTGRGSGFHLDAVTHTGPDGLPRLPGRTLKGLLRDAVHRAEQWGWPKVPAGSTEALFGPIGRDGQPTHPGLLRISDATLPDEVATYLATDDGKPLVSGLYREHFSTAIDATTGVATSRSLRGMQVVVPLTLEALIAEIPGVAAVPDWPIRIEAILPLVTAVGAQRNRGFGRAHLSWKKEG
ncbi:MAG: RAMP superfamily CRISPR-associated protein [Candidatus Contendobacter sp.]|nr:RAMP superfamily CRISPR-associated protein [Candidatus Contendobacter sp.]MDS4059536.1 RAMP superfamily CRISPR-associated protein [Candidatus Contendobacter sp.]